MSINPDVREKYIEYLMANMPEKRFLHTLGTKKAAIDLAKRFGEDIAKAETAALLHDAGKYYKDKTAWAEAHGIDDEILLKSPGMLHGYISADIAEREFKITDSDILNAIKYHTTARKGMSKLEKIIYLADLIEETRTLDGLEPIRHAAKTDLDEAVILAIEYVVDYVMRQKKILHTDSILAYNELITNRR